VELGVVLSVAAILAAMIVPDYLESSRVKMAGRAAEDVVRIQDAARWYRVEHTAGPAEFYWPGQRNGATPRPDTCVNAASGDITADLVTASYLPASDSGMSLGFKNPWGEPYTLNLINDVPSGSCLFRVSTLLPASMATAFKSFMPGAECFAPSGGKRVCYSQIPEPGREPGNLPVAAAIDDFFDAPPRPIVPCPVNSGGRVSSGGTAQANAGNGGNGGNARVEGNDGRDIVSPGSAPSGRSGGTGGDVTSGSNRATGGNGGNGGRSGEAVSGNAGSSSSGSGGCDEDDGSSGGGGSASGNGGNGGAGGNASVTENGGNGSARGNGTNRSNGTTRGNGANRSNAASDDGECLVYQMVNGRQQCVGAGTVAQTRGNGSPTQVANGRTGTVDNHSNLPVPGPSSGTLVNNQRGGSTVGSPVVIRNGSFVPMP
jgi:type II secretory pathway pseudopilin PulG